MRYKPATAQQHPEKTENSNDCYDFPLVLYNKTLFECQNRIRFLCVFLNPNLFFRTPMTVRLIFVAVALAFCICKNAAWGAAEAQTTVEAVAERNNKKLEIPWLVIKAGKNQSSGYSLSPDGSISHAGKPLQSKIEVIDSKGKASNTPSEVRISPPSPSGAFALLTACEPDEAETSLCWFQYLADLKSGKLHQVTWAKYPSPTHVWWAQDDSFAVIPISDEGEVWLSALDLKKLESRDIHFYAPALTALASKRCNASDENVVIDLDTLQFTKINEISIAVSAACSQPARPITLIATVKLDTGTVTIVPANSPVESKKDLSAGPSFDCSKAGSTVERMICADEHLAKLDNTLVSTYKDAMEQAANRDEMKSQQLNWLRQVRNRCTTASCLADAYQKRIAELNRLNTALAEGVPSPFPATYRGGFTGDEMLTFTGDGRIMEGENIVGSYQKDRKSPWPDARYPFVIIQTVDGETQKRPCKITPDMLKMLCDEGGTMASEFERVGPAPAAKLSAAKKCDDEQLYLDVMAAARKARPDLDLKGASDIRMISNGKCFISLYYLKDGQPIDIPATYDLNVRPVVLVLTGEP